MSVLINDEGAEAPPDREQNETQPSNVTSKRKI